MTPHSYTGSVNKNEYERYVNKSQGKLKLRANGLEITHKRFRSIKERKAITDCWVKCFDGLRLQGRVTIDVIHYDTIVDNVSLVTESEQRRHAKMGINTSILKEIIKNISIAFDCELLKKASARHAFCYLAKKITKLNNRIISEFSGHKTRSGVYISQRTATNLMITDLEFKAKVEKIYFAIEKKYLV